MKNILFNKLNKEGYNFFCGVPDSGLKEFQNSIIESNFKNVIATNEGQAIGIAVGAMMAGLKPCVYMQNSGLGAVLAKENFINPSTAIPSAISSLIHSIFGSIFVVLFKNLE